MRVILLGVVLIVGCDQAGDQPVEVAHIPTAEEQKLQKTADLPYFSMNDNLVNKHHNVRLNLGRKIESYRSCLNTVDYYSKKVAKAERLNDGSSLEETKKNNAAKALAKTALDRVAQIDTHFKYCHELTLKLDSLKNSKTTTVEQVEKHIYQMERAFKEVDAESSKRFEELTAKYLKDLEALGVYGIEIYRDVGPYPIEW